MFTALSRPRPLPTAGQPFKVAPIDSGTLDAPLEAPLGGGGIGTAAPPPMVAPAPAPAPVAPTPAPAAPTPAPVDAGGGALGITQLPDGSGGSVAVPPLALAPPSVIPPTPAPPIIASPPAAEPAVPPWLQPPDAGLPGAIGDGGTSFFTPAADSPWEVPVGPAGGSVTGGQGSAGAVAPAVATPIVPPVTESPAPPPVGLPLEPPPFVAPPSPVQPPAITEPPPYVPPPLALPPIPPAISEPPPYVPPPLPGDATTGQGATEAGPVARPFDPSTLTPTDLTPSIPTALPSLPVTPPGVISEPAFTTPPWIVGGGGVPGPTDTGGSIPMPGAPGIVPTTDPTVTGQPDAALTAGGGTASVPVGAPVPPPATTPSVVGNNEGSVTDAALPGTYSPDSNLIASQVTPGPDPRLAAYQSALDQIMGKITNGPDRLALAQQYYDTFDKATEPAFSHSLTDATDEAAAHGRLQSGQLTNRYGDLTQQRLLDKETQKRILLNDAVAGTIGDTQNAFSDISGAEGKVFGEGEANRGELRTERDFQTQQAQKAVMQRILEQQAEAGQTQQAFENALKLYQTGNAADPTAALTGAAGAAGAEADTSNAAILALIKAYMAQHATTG